MAKHEFGIMELPPKANERYDTYEPERYDCISVDDDYLEPLLEKLSAVDCYWHTLQQPGKGLAYCGITLIPPASAGEFADLCEGKAGMEELERLLRKAKEDNKFVIHFGI